jgi:hypothetical protein
MNQIKYPLYSLHIARGFLVLRDRGFLTRVEYELTERLERVLATLGWSKI